MPAVVVVYRADPDGVQDPWLGLQLSGTYQAVALAIWVRHKQTVGLWLFSGS